MAQTKYYLLLLLVCIIWGATPACGKLTVEAFSPLMITGMRFALMSAALFTFIIISRDKKSLVFPKEILWVVVAMGFMGVLVHNGLLFLGLTYTTATNTALIESIGPTVTTLLAFFFLGERLNIFGWGGIFISCIGALCIVTKGDINILLALKFNIGDILILCCEVAWSAYVIISWNAHNKISTLGLTAWSSLFGALWCFVVGGVTGSLEVYEVTSGALWGFAYLVICSGIFAFVAWNYGVQHVGASKAGVFIYIVPLTGGIIGVFVLGEAIAIAQIIGALMIMGGVMVTVRSKVRLRNESDAAIDKDEKNLLKKFPELAEAHDAKLQAMQQQEKQNAAKTITTTSQMNSVETVDNSDTVAGVKAKNTEV